MHKQIAGQLSLFQGNAVKVIPSRKNKKRPKIGTKMYMVKEHLFYIAGYPAPVLEYCICEGEVRRFITLNHTEIELIALSPEGYRTPYYYKTSDVNKRVFFTLQEAVLLAKQKTEKYERTWGWIGVPDIPMRRPWEDEGYGT